MVFRSGSEGSVSEMEPFVVPLSDQPSDFERQQPKDERDRGKESVE